MRAQNDALPCANCTSAWSQGWGQSCKAGCGFYRVYPDRLLLVRALAQGCSEKQRMFQTYHAAPDDEAAARAASAARACFSAPYSPCRAIFRPRTVRWEGLNRPYRWIEMYTMDV